ncbi:hypothetical protein [Bdellovibrio sp. HCB337]|uniref:hypothetical protein n=1 Tax=Bdellovibrio sp. HCB337 TaxID=3394358 RepID=UPI0039A46E09
MKKTLIILVVSLSSLSAQAAFLTCFGTNEAKNEIVLTIENAFQTTRQEFKSVDIYAQVYPFAGAEVYLIPQEVPGCQGALLAGSKGQVLQPTYSGDLYIECDGDGDAGYMTLKKKKNGQYAAVFHGPNGKPALNLNDEEEVKMVCVAK